MKQWSLPSLPSPAPPARKRILLTGHFTTVGDLEVLDVARSWLDEAGLPNDVAPYGEAYRAILPGSVDWRSVPSEPYFAVMFICGPMVTPECIPSFFDRFSHCAMYGLNLSLGPWLGDFSPFTKVWPRDDGETVNPDLSLAYQETNVPVVGVCVVQSQDEYGGKQRHAVVDAMIEEFLSANDYAIIRSDTEALKSRNVYGPSSIGAVTSLLAACDVVISTRLHGMVLSLKRGVPVVAIDGISGGAKVLAQARVLGWPHVVTADELTRQWLEDHFQQCLSPQARRLARQCAAQGRLASAGLRAELLQTLTRELQERTIRDGKRATEGDK